MDLPKVPERRAEEAQIRAEMLTAQIACIPDHECVKGYRAKLEAELAALEPMREDPRPTLAKVKSKQEYLQRREKALAAATAALEAARADFEQVRKQQQPAEESRENKRLKRSLDEAETKAKVAGVKSAVPRRRLDRWSHMNHSLNHPSRTHLADGSSEPTSTASGTTIPGA